MIIPVGPLVGLLGGATLTVERRSAPTIDDYGETTHTTTSTPLTIAVHQATRRQLERAGLDHTQDWRAFYSASELRLANASGAGDIVQYGGERWELTHLADYDAIGGIHIALGKRIE